MQGLGLMYVEDERFSANIDRAGEPGTASFVSQAIAIYCQE
ncbi:TipAS antibiotic-recognition domain-containing protein [Streptococcus suis]